MWQKVFGYLQYLFNTYRLVPVLLELLLIGFVVYSVIRFLRGTGGEKLFKGIVFLLLGFWLVGMLTRSLDLERIDFLFEYFLVGVLVVATIAFQPELRRGLMRLGGTRFGRTNLPQTEQVIEKIVDAAATLSRTQIGALIAVEREVGLGDWVAAGVPIDAQVTAELLNTIFWPGSPLHDMGVVIRQDRIAAAGVQFPLAEHGEYDRLLGSRHRAAIGLSNQTDAVVIVLSEETGNIGLAIQGKLNRFLTLEQLRRQLFESLLPRTDRQAERFFLARWLRRQNQAPGAVGAEGPARPRPAGPSVPPVSKEKHRE
ncbi:MAG: diadenylate cyclase CdaA [Sedimentisphaerales bacterium]|nr:diadenylate cyclase CdaA [Sedimentisphaerales bacterium]